MKKQLIIVLVSVVLTIPIIFLSSAIAFGVGLSSDPLDSLFSILLIPFLLFSNFSKMLQIPGSSDFLVLVNVFIPFFSVIIVVDLIINFVFIAFKKRKEILEEN